MEHINVLNRIIEAENNARAMADEALSKREHLNKDIEIDREKLKEDYMKSAQERIEIELERERAQSSRMIAELEEKLASDLNEVDRKLTARREELTLKVFKMIIEDDE